MENTKIKQKNRKAVIITLIAIAVLGSFGIVGSYLSLKNYKIEISPEKAKEYQELLKLNKKHIEKVRNANDESTEIAIKNVKIMFERIREKIPGTVSELYSLKSKCKYIGKGIADKWPWSKKRDRLTTMVEGIFEEHLGSDKDFKKSLAKIETDYRRSLVANKNNLLLNLSFDTTVNNKKTSEIKKETFIKLFEEQISEFAGPMVGISLAGDVSSFIVSEAVSVVVVNVVASATGCAIGGAATLGVGILVGVGVDLIVTKCAKETMIKKLTVAMNEMEKVILNGTEDVPGMVAELNQKSKQMTIAEEKAVKTALVLACR